MMKPQPAPPLHTITDLAGQTGLEESLLRFYESEYPDRLPPKVLRGEALLLPRMPPKPSAKSTASTPPARPMRAQPLRPVSGG